MRLYKKAAVCLLAAAMALSMLTACGGNDNPGGGDNPDSKPGTSEGGEENPGGSEEKPGGGSSVVVPTPDDVILPGETGDDGQEDAKKIPIDVSKSKLVAFYNKRDKASEWYTEVATYTYEDKVLRGEQASIAAHKGTNLYEYINLKMDGKNTELEALFVQNKKNSYDGYLLFRDDKVAVKVGELDQKMIDTNPVDHLPLQIWSTKVKVGSREYDAETYTDDMGAVYTYCYEPDGTPKYVFTELNGMVGVVVYRSIQIGIGASKDLCRMPSGTKSYTYIESQDNRSLKDEQGNVYIVDNKKATVADASGKDVTSEFGWVKKLLDIEL